MRDLIIGKSVAYANDGDSGTIAGSWESTTLADGALAIVDNGGTLLAANVASITAPYVQILTKVGTSQKTSFPLHKGKVKYNKLAYSAPVAGIKFLGSEAAAADGTYSLNLPSTITAGQQVGIQIVDLSKAHEDNSRYHDYAFTVLPSDVLTGTGASNIVAKLVALVNADSKKIVTALAHTDGTDNDGIKFTADTAGVDFGISALDGVLMDAEVTTGTSSFEGAGTYAQVLDLYKATASRDGNQQYLVNQDLLWGGTSNLSATGTYTMYKFETEVPNTDAISKSNNPSLQLVIAVPSGASAVIAALDNLGAKIV